MRIRANSDVRDCADVSSGLRPSPVIRVHENLLARSRCRAPMRSSSSPPMPDPRSSIVFKPGVVSAQLVYTAVGIHQYGFRHHQYCSKYTIQRGGDASSVELHVSLRSESFCCVLYSTCTYRTRLRPFCVHGRNSYQQCTAKSCTHDTLITHTQLRYLQTAYPGSRILLRTVSR